MEALLTAINSKYEHTALGLRSVAAWARARGHKVALIEDSINSLPLAVLDRIMKNLDEETKAAGFSVHIWNKNFVFQLAALLKKLRPDVKIVLGGPEVSYEPGKIFAELPAADFIVQGEGEEVFCELLKFFEGKNALPPHVAVRTATGVLPGRGGQAKVAELSLLPFPYPDLAQAVAEKRILYYEASRGCPFGCTYCLSGSERGVRLRPLARIEKELRLFAEAGAHLVKFTDRTANSRPDFGDLLRFLGELDCETCFHFELKAELLTEELLEIFSALPPGRVQAEVGIQSTCSAALRAIHRSNDWPLLAKNVKALVAGGKVHVHTDLIAGLPCEDYASFEKSFDDVYSLGAQQLQLGFLKVLPGTLMRAEAKEHGLIFTDQPPYEVLATKYMTYDELAFLKKVAAVFEQVHNSGHFKATLNFLTKQQKVGAFSFYAAFTRWWCEHAYYPQRHNAKSTAEILSRYIEEETEEEVKEEARERLRFDVFCSFPSWRPDFLFWRADEEFAAVGAFWRNIEEVRRYLPAYAFTSWRGIKKRWPLALFTVDPFTGERGRFWYLFDTEEERAVQVTSPALP